MLDVVGNTFVLVVVVMRSWIIIRDIKDNIALILIALDI
jgi:hypothetical protein